MKKLILFLLLIALHVNIATAAIYRVSPDGTADYTTISAAVTASASNDTIVVGGSLAAFIEDVSLPHPLTLIGQGNGCFGTSSSRLSGHITLQADVCSGTVIEGLCINNTIVADNPVHINGGNLAVVIRRCLIEPLYGSSGIYIIGNSTVTVENCIVRNGSQGVHVQDTGTAYLVNTVIADNGYSVFIATSTATVFATNCAFIGAGGAGALEGNGTWAVDNCVLWNCAVTNNITGSITVSYNAYCSTITGWPSGTGDVVLTADPYVNYNETAAYQFCGTGSPTDLHPGVASPLIDAGNPSLPDDIEGAGDPTRDIGVYGGELPMVDNGAPDFPFVISLLVAPSVPQNGVLEIRATGRVGRGL